MEEVAVVAGKKELTDLGDATTRASAADEGLHSCELGSGVVSL